MTSATRESAKWWNRTDWLMLGFNVAVLAIVFAVFDRQLPAVVGSHFDINGNQDGTMPKWGFWLLNAGLTVGLPILLKVLRYADPRKANYESFAGTFDLTRWVLSIFMQGIILTVILTNLDYEIPTIQIVLGGLGLLWMVIGNRLGQVRSTFFFGIRTPWALADEQNWKMTHRFGAKLWFAAGLAMFAACWFARPSWVLPILIGCVLLSVVLPALYSYLLFARKPSR